MTDDDADREDALFTAPPEGFVAARDALARQLRSDGDRVGARRVRALRRPTRAAWAINVAVSDDPDAARSLAEAAGQLGDAQRELLGGGEPALLRDAQARVDAVVAVLLEAVPVDDAATLVRVRQTLRAAVVDAEALADVLGGRLLRERVISGFGDLGGALQPIAQESAPAATAPSSASAAKAVERAAREAQRQAAQAAERAAAERRARVERARAAETAAQEAAVAARATLGEAEAVVERRRAERDAAESRLADAARERERAEQS